MSIQDVSFAKVFRVLAFGSIVWLLAFLSIWGECSEWVQAMKIAIGPAVGWILGNLPETGMIVPSMDGLRK